MKRDTKARRDNAERENVRRFNATLEREATRMQSARGRNVKATAHACVQIATEFMQSHCAYGYPAREIATQALAHYGHEFAAVGMNPDNPEHFPTVKVFREVVSKRVWHWLHAGRDGKRMSGKVGKLAADAARRNAGLHIWIGNPEARLMELQDIVSRNRGRDDAMVLRAIVAANEMQLPTGATSATDMPVSAQRIIIDVSRTDTDAARHAAQSTFIVHKPGKTPEIHKAA